MLFTSFWQKSAVQNVAAQLVGEGVAWGVDEYANRYGDVSVMVWPMYRGS